MPETTKTIGIFGGNEFQENCLETDREFCNLSSVTKSNVLILPTAATNENPELAARNGINHFNKIGIEASALNLINKNQSNDSCFLNPINKFSIIYLTGGNPLYLNTILQNSQALSEIKKALTLGSILLGSSAGAMVMGKYILLDKLVPGLNLIPDTIIVPHFENNNDMNNLVNISRNHNVDILGLDTQAACITANNNWVTLGNKKITLIGKNNIQEYSKSKTRIPLKFQPTF